MLKLLFLGIACIGLLSAVEIPEGLPDKSAYLVKKFETDSEKERSAAEREIDKLRDKLMDNLEKEMKSVTKKGDLEEALQIKSIIEALQQEQRESAVDIFGSKQTSAPRINFLAEKSMPLYPVGTRHGPFPAQESDDATTVFMGKPIFFDQRTDVDDVVYEVQLPRPAKKLIYDGSAAQNLTIVVTDPKGNVLGSGGPWGGGNVPLQFSVDFKASQQFVITLSNHVSNWFYIGNIKFE